MSSSTRLKFAFTLGRRGYMSLGGINCERGVDLLIEIYSLKGRGRAYMVFFVFLCFDGPHDLNDYYFT